MNATTDFERMVATWLEHDGPAVVGTDVVDAALTTARTRAQRRGIRAVLAGPAAWPARRTGSFSPVLLVGLLIAVLVGGLLLAGAARLLDRTPVVTHGGGFVPAGAMSTARADSTAVRLADGRVLVVGGWDGLTGERPHSGVTSAEIYDPVTREFTPTGSMHEGRVSPTATLLADGRVLVAGGFPFRSMNVGPATGLVSAELYDPATETFTPTGPMTEGRGDHVAVRIATGEVLVFGGVGGVKISGASATLIEPRMVERFDPATGSFAQERAANTLAVATAAIALTDGRILTVSTNGAPESIALYDVVKGTLRPVSGSDLDAHTAIELRDGRVLLAGSSRGDSGNAVQLFDPAAETFGGVVVSVGGIEQAVELRDGRVLILGRGLVPSGQPDTSVEAMTFELFDSASGTLRPVAPMANAPSNGSYISIALADDSILFAGGASTSETGVITPSSSAFTYASD